MLINSVWRNPNIESGFQENFQLIPVGETCPYVEVIYMPAYQSLVILSKIQKESMHMVDKLDDNGERMKTSKPRESKYPYKEERRIVKTFNEYYITDEKDMEEFIKLFAINADTFDYKKYMSKPIQQKESVIEKIPTDLVGINGEKLVKE